MSIFSGNNSDEESVPKISIPLYIAGLVIQFASALIVGRQVGDMRFAYFSMALATVGAALAYYLRLRRAPKQPIQYGVLIAGAIFLMASRGLGVFSDLLPYEAQGSQELTIVSGLALASTFCTFLWLSDEAVVFTCVWAIAIIGLTGTVNINRELIFGFATFLAGAVFLLVHQNALFQSGRSGVREGEDAPPPVREMDAAQLRSQLLISGTVWAAALLLGFLVAIPVQMLGRNLSLNAIIQRLKVPVSPVGKIPSGKMRLAFDNLEQFKIGLGPVEDDPSEHMHALSEEPHYWRGRVYDQYTGQDWKNTMDSTGVSIPPNGGESADGYGSFILRPLIGPRGKTTKVTHRFHVVNGIFGPLFHAVEPLAVRAPVLTIIQRDDNTIGCGRGMGAEYEVDSEVSDPKPSDLRKTTTNYSPEIARRYLSIGPPNDALEALAREATTGAASNPYDRTQAVRRFVAQRCVYTRDARAVPRDRDAAEFFLNESKEGYCDLYATALTILCRYAGLPARVVTGFAPGSPAAAGTVPPVKSGDPRQWYVLRGSDLHAWTEVYFEGYGWVAFDATQDTGATVTPSVTPQPIVRENIWEQFWKSGGAAIVLSGLAAISLIFVGVNELFSRLRLRQLRYGSGAGRSEEVAQVYRNTISRFRKRGLERAAAATPGEFLRQARFFFSDTVTEPLGRLTALVENSLYSPTGATADDIRTAQAQSRQTLSALRAHPKIAKKAETDAAAKGGNDAASP